MPAPAKKAAPVKKATPPAPTKKTTPPPTKAAAPAKPKFVGKATGVADDIAKFVVDTQTKLEKLTEAHTEATEAHAGDTGHAATAYQLDRVTTALDDVARPLTALGSVASSLSAEAATAED